MNPWKKIIIHFTVSFLLSFISTTVSFSQEIPDTSGIPKPALGPYDTIPVPAMVFEHEWIPGGNLPWIFVNAPYPKDLLKKRQEWTRLRNAVYVTYPFARKAGIIMNDINAKLSRITDEGERKKYIKSREKELKKEFADPLKDLSIYQGKVLMKLINRQTGNNCYEIIKEYKGGLTARLYQTVAFVFGSNLKQTYNPYESDREIESIVMEVERMYGGRM